MQRRTLIIGSGSCARSIAEDLLKEDIEIIVAVRGDSADFFSPEQTQNTSGEVLTHTRIVKCTGAAGNFLVRMDQNGKNIERNVSNIIVAGEDRRDPNFALYGLTPSSHIVSLSQLMDRLDSPQENLLSQEGKIAFLTGISNESNPVITKEIMRCALRVQSSSKVQAYVFTKNLKVAGDGLEALYRKTKDAGVVYFKFTDTLPSMEQGQDGKGRISFDDEITNQRFRLTSSLTVVDETIKPSEHLSELSTILKIDKDGEGFAQTDNVHRIRVLTNRKGILAAGPGRAVQSVEEQNADASNAVLRILGLFEERAPEATINKAEINRRKCVRCLTCYRLCPYRAIQLDTKPLVVPEACEGCGICTAECPKGTITIEGLSGSEVSDQIKKPDSRNTEKSFTPFIVAFCCRRSAARAWELALETGHDLPSGLKIVELPCAGCISYDHIFAAFKKGADGIMVITCHEGNCHSEKGNIFARQRTDMVFGLLTQMGFEKERLIIKTLAANMAMEFSEFTSKFENQIIDLGPSRIKGEEK